MSTLKALIILATITPMFRSSAEEIFFGELDRTASPNMAINVQKSWTKLRFTLYNQIGHKSLYKNSTHVAFELGTAAAKNPLAIYKEFKELVTAYQDSFLVDYDSYLPYITTLGNAPSPPEKLPRNSNLSIYLLKPTNKGPFTRLRLFFPKAFKFPQYGKIFTGNRLGLAYLNQDVESVFSICFYNPDFPYKYRPGHCRTTNHMHRNLFSYSLHLKPENNLYLFDLYMHEKDPLNVKEAKSAFLKFHNEMRLSKKLLRALGFIGFHNHDDGVHVDFGLSAEKNNKGNFYARRLSFMRNQQHFTFSPVFEEIRENCYRIKNTIFKWDSLGVRSRALDIIRSNYRLYAFEERGFVNYVFSFADFHSYVVTNVWEAANEEFQRIVSCEYHDDNYNLPLELNEMYLITFRVQKAQSFQRQYFII